MKKLIVACFFAAGLVACSQQQASAWVNSRFSIGLNLDHSSGGNSFLWGLWRNGQIPGPDGGGMPYGMPYGGMPYGAPRMAPAQPGSAPAPQGFAPQAYPAQTFAPQGYPAFQGNFEMPSAERPVAGMNYGSPYQFANYPRPVYYYPSPYYYEYGR